MESTGADYTAIVMKPMERNEGWHNIKTLNSNRRNRIV